MAKRGRPRKETRDTVAGRAALKREAKTSPRMGKEELACYASGNGALSFVWQALDYERGSKIATGRHVTMDDVRTWMGTTERGRELIQDGYRLWPGDGGGPYLVGPFERTGPNTLRRDGREYRYECGLDIGAVDAEGFRRYDTQQVMQNLRMFIRLEGETKEHDVRHISTLASAAFFLTHEKDLAARPPETFTYPVTGQ